jgi:hypothetical protein
MTFMNVMRVVCENSILQSGLKNLWMLQFPTNQFIDVTNCKKYMKRNIFEFKLKDLESVIYIQFGFTAMLNSFK